MEDLVVVGIGAVDEMLILAADLDMRGAAELIVGVDLAIGILRGDRVLLRVEPLEIPLVGVGQVEAIGVDGFADC